MKKYKVRPLSPVWWVGVIFTVLSLMFIVYGCVALGGEM